MGKPFAKELTKISETINWAKSIELNDLTSLTEENVLWIVGSGGSLSACELLSLLHTDSGKIGLAITPLELQYRKNSFNSNSHFVFLSASGRNSDILFSLRTTANYDPKQITSICFKRDSKLKIKADSFSFTRTHEFEIPSGKDGFLATNSLVAYFVILARIYGHAPSFSKGGISQYQRECDKFLQPFNRESTFIVLYAGWSKPVAIDIESKFSEAGLGSIILCDYRNFGHGRHNWFDKQSNTAIVALVTPTEKELANKTLQLLPDNISKHTISSELVGHNASIDLLVKSFYFVNVFGKLVSIDPGQPGVPEYGSKLYRLNYSRLFEDKKDQKLTNNELLSIKRKIGNLNNHPDHIVARWGDHCKNYKKSLSKTKFRGIILDYDGTICSNSERFTKPSAEISNFLNEMLDNNILVAMATGRGKSIRHALEEIIKQEHHQKLIIGYYNSGQLATLSDKEYPHTDPNNESVLSKIHQTLNIEDVLSNNIKQELRLGQLSINILEKQRSAHIKRVMTDIIHDLFPNQVQILESSHSIDIIDNKTSKLDSIEFLKKHHSLSNDDNFLRIGDRGLWPGNDYALLTGPHSLSVDQVSSSPYSCWNFSKLGMRNVESTLDYFRRMKFSNRSFQIKL